MADNKGEILIYQTEDGLTNIEVKMQDETVWLTQAQLVRLYDTSKANISEHIKHIFEEEELDKESVVRKFRTTAADGKTYNTAHYSLDMIISLGYRVKSKTATRFRRWATDRLKEYMNIDRCLTFMQPVWIMIRIARLPLLFSKLCKINCILLPTGIRQQR